MLIRFYTWFLLLSMWNIEPFYEDKDDNHLWLTVSLLNWSLHIKKKKTVITIRAEICWQVSLSILSKCASPPTSRLSAASVVPSDAGGSPAVSSVCVDRQSSDRKGAVEIFP